VDVDGVGALERTNASASGVLVTNSAALAAAAADTNDRIVNKNFMDVNLD